VLDVKCGSGAFMDSLPKARALAESLVRVANDAGCRTTALITDMNEPLARTAGNALEMQNAVDFLTGKEIDNRLWDVTVALGAELLANAGLAASVENGANMMLDALQSGRAAERFGKMVAALGGPVDFVEKPQSYLETAPLVAEVYAAKTGFVQSIDTRGVGMAVVALGGGRTRSTDPIDYAVGLDWLAGIGQYVDTEQPIARVHARDQATLDEAKTRIIAAYKIGAAVPEETPLIIERIA